MLYMEENQIVTMTDSYIIVTGASGSMGKAACRNLVRKGEKVIMACRSVEKAEKAREEILAGEGLGDACLEIKPLDLCSFASVRAFASALGDTKVKALFNNAGTMPRRYGLTSDGYERACQVNFLSPLLLSALLKGNLTPEAQIVNMVSLTCRLVGTDTMLTERGGKDYGQLSTYARTKRALLLCGLEFSARSGIRVNFSDPGIVNSSMISLDRWFDPLADVLFRPFCKSPEKGVQSALLALNYNGSGKLFTSSGMKDLPRSYSRDKDKAALLLDKAMECAGFSL